LHGARVQKASGADRFDDFSKEMTMRSLRVVAVVMAGLASAISAPAVLAHPFGAHGAGFGAGFAHPFLGLDHLAAMIAVGLWAAQSGWRPVWGLPLVFLLMMAFGAGLAFAGVPLPAVEAGIAASVFVLGLLIAAAVRLPAIAAVAIVATFAVFHGHAHGAELPQTAAPWLYAAGFLLATGALHAAGIALGRSTAPRLAWAARTVGLLLTAAGTWMLVA
jgi:urease accessory protein